MKRVIIFCNRAVDVTGLNSLLAWDACLDVVGWEVEPDEAIRRIQQIQPKMIIIAHEETPLSPSAEAVRLLEETSDTTIVEMGLQDRKICIYRGEQAMLQQIEELLASIP
jgi:AmiR/NasT family two-component response regulator